MGLARNIKQYSAQALDVWRDVNEAKQTVYEDGKTSIVLQKLYAAQNKISALIEKLGGKPKKEVHVIKEKNKIVVKRVPIPISKSGQKNIKKVRLQNIREKLF